MVYVSFRGSLNIGGLRRSLKRSNLDDLRVGCLAVGLTLQYPQLSHRGVQAPCPLLPTGWDWVGLGHRVSASREEMGSTSVSGVCAVVRFDVDALNSILRMVN